MGSDSDDRWLVVGLGNPGPRYAGNRHNVGHMVLDVLAQRSSERWKGHKTRTDVAVVRIEGVPTVLAKPRSYMNVSGGPVAGVSDFFSVPVDRVVVVHDDMDIPFGAIKIKRGGGAGGHNGLRSISKSLSAPDYVRVRFGVGRPPGSQDAADYVLRDFSSTERKELDVELERAADAVEAVLAHGVEKAQNTFHGS
ncbi:aminoacyl-tRNA hydrolase [Spiractinospora alimapuensis]|uniref:aminoacyl-tRNA hydrolase n=1 Tax=Spiractinospora alimapuensis TaxID=2820884 RepID=UPI001EEA66EB|nr:aminoacyl-tRNA hydrolase [Spiractinospora alimapuensis]QVQ55073.1 aminoacyl-tRNA hydrolase [Spiractinospora alimapuensis]